MNPIKLFNEEDPRLARRVLCGAQRDEAYPWRSVDPNYMWKLREPPLNLSEVTASDFLTFAQGYLYRNKRQLPNNDVDAPTINLNNIMEEYKPKEPVVTYTVWKQCELVSLIQTTIILMYKSGFVYQKSDFFCDIFDTNNINNVHAEMERLIFKHFITV